MDRKPEQVLRETLDELDDALRNAERHWRMIDELAQLLLQKGELSTRETFEWITARVDLDDMVLQYEHKLRKTRGEYPGGGFIAPRPVVKEKPDIIQESDLDSILFGCCGYTALHPFKCPLCGHIMVYCRECDTLFPNLRDTNQTWLYFGFDHLLTCPGCNYAFEQDLQRFLNNPAYHVTPIEWANAGHASLLTDSARSKKLGLPR